MFKFLFSKLWFSFIPLVVYLIWVNIGEDKEHATKQKAKKLAIGLALGIVICATIYIGITTEENDGVYTPAKFENGVLIDGKIE